jgi:hypothetical protein
MAARYDLKVNQGETFTRSFTYKNPDGSLINLTGYTARMQVRTNYDASAVALELTDTNGGITLGGVLGTVVINITPTQTLAMVMSSLVGMPPYQNFVYDLEITTGSNIKKFLNGFFTLTKAVIR